MLSQAAPLAVTGSEPAIPPAHVRAATAPPSSAVQDGLERVVTRAAIVFRGASCATIALLVFAINPGPTATARKVVVAAAALGWGIIVWLVCRHRDTLPVWLVVTDAILFSLPLLAMGLLLPHDLVGNGATWVFAPVTVSILLAAWRLPLWLGAMVPVMAMGAYVAGLALAGVSFSPVQAAEVVVYPIQFIIGWLVIKVMRRSAHDADIALDELEAAHQQEAVELARERDRRARRLALHDTVLNALTAIARGGLAGRTSRIRQRCQQDLEWLQTMQDAGASNRPVPVEDLLAQVRQDAAGRGLVASVSSPSATLLLRSHVAAAMSQAAREALSNAERHAGVQAVDVKMDGDTDRLTMIIADAGRGFDPVRIRPGTVGLPNSILGRMRDVGGDATVDSAPGRGTVVTLTWSADPSQREDTFALALRRLLAGAYTGGVAKAVVSVALLWHLFSLSGLIANWHAYRSAILVLAAWLAMLAVGIFLGIKVTRLGEDRASSANPGIDGRQALIATTVLLTAMLVTVLSCDGPGLVGKANWAVGNVGWFIAILAVYRPLWEAGIALAFVAVANLTVAALQPHGALPYVALMVGNLFNIMILQVSAITMFRILNRNVDTGAAAVERLNELLIERAARAAIIQDRTARYRNLNQSLLPLLGGLADGALDPETSEVQQRCEVAAGVVRALITHDDGTASVASLDAVATVSEAAENRRIVLDLQVDPSIDGLPRPARDHLLSILTRTLSRAKVGEASLTLLGSDSTATVTACLPLAIPAEELQRQTDAAAAELMAVVGGTAEADLERLDSGLVWLEVKWKR